MEKLLLVITAIAVSGCAGVSKTPNDTKAQARTVASAYSVPLGSNAQIAPGDVISVSYGGLTSQISCGQAFPPPPPAQPDHFDFSKRELVNTMFQNTDDNITQMSCEHGEETASSQRAQTLLRDATNDCQRNNWSVCRQLGQTQYEFVPRAQNKGNFGCFVRVIVRGSN